jgi:hypothetical protein
MSTSDFLLLSEQSIPELNTRARLFRHAPTGAELLSLENDDENKVFGITFHAPPIRPACRTSWNTFCVARRNTHCESLLLS